MAGYTIPREQRAELMKNFIEAVRVSIIAGKAIQPDAEERQDADIARETLCLHEISERYKKIVQRWEPLDVLSFHDPLIEEAARAYLYGFYRATVVLSACALEDWLKRLAGTERLGEDDYYKLVKKRRSEEYWIKMPPGGPYSSSKSAMPRHTRIGTETRDGEICSRHRQKIAE